VRVLIVDDDLRFAQVVSAALADRFVVVGTVTVAADLDRALAVLDPDVVVLDLVLGTDNGLELAEGLRARGNDVPIVMFSSLFRRDVDRDSLDSGFPWVEKADGVEALEAGIDVAIARRAA